MGQIVPYEISQFAASFLSSGGTKADETELCLFLVKRQQAEQGSNI